MKKEEEKPIVKEEKPKEDHGLKICESCGKTIYSRELCSCKPRDYNIQINLK